MMLHQLMRSMPTRLGRRMLTFDEVLASGRPAVFDEFGDLLAYLDGTVFILQGVDVQETSEAGPPVLDPRSVVRAVGIETGWRHADDCDCHVCAEGTRAA